MSKQFNKWLRQMAAANIPVGDINQATAMYMGLPPDPPKADNSAAQQAQARVESAPAEAKQDAAASIGSNVAGNQVLKDMLINKEASLGSIPTAEPPADEKIQVELFGGKTAEQWQQEYSDATAAYSTLDSTFNEYKTQQEASVINLQDQISALQAQNEQAQLDFKDILQEELLSQQGTFNDQLQKELLSQQQSFDTMLASERLSNETAMKGLQQELASMKIQNQNPIEAPTADASGIRLKDKDRKDMRSAASLRNKLDPKVLLNLSQGV